MALGVQLPRREVRICERVEARVSGPRSLGSPTVSFSALQSRFAFRRPLTRIGSVARYLPISAEGEGGLLARYHFLVLD